MSNIDPTAIVDAIANGATWSSNHLVEGGVDKWVKVNGLTWEITTSSGDKKMRAGVFDQLSQATVNPDNTVTCPAGTFRLEVSGSYAVLLDPL